MREFSTTVHQNWEALIRQNILVIKELNKQSEAAKDITEWKELSFIRVSLVV